MALEIPLSMAESRPTGSDWRALKRSCRCPRYVPTARFIVVIATDCSPVQWTFTLGLALSSAVDALVTISLFALLKENGGKEYLRYVY